MVDGPRQLGKYELKRKLAVGGMAEIWLSEQTGPAGFAKTLVVKRILPHLANDAKFVEMFLDEARLAAHLEHPNIVRITDLGAVDGSFFIAMEYIDGPDLAYLIDRCEQLDTHVPLPLAARIVADALAGLDYAHNYVSADGTRLNLVHRDISPHNILISSAGITKIVDFGVAKAATSTHKTQTGAVKGKFAYMSPEQIANVELDARSDLFAMGIVLFELTTGRAPFGGELAAVTAILTKPPTSPREIVTGFPPEMEKIIMRALAKHPSDRYASAADMQRALEHFIHETGTLLTTRDLAQGVADLLSPQPSLLQGQSAPPAKPRYEPIDSGTIEGIEEPETGVFERREPITVPGATNAVAEVSVQAEPVLVEAESHGSVPASRRPAGVRETVREHDSEVPASVGTTPGSAAMAAVERRGRSVSKGLLVGAFLLLLTLIGAGVAAVFFMLDASPPPTEHITQPTTPKAKAKSAKAGKRKGRGKKKGKAVTTSHRSGRLIIHGVDGAAVVHEGVEVGVTPDPIPLPAGRLALTLKRRGDGVLKQIRVTVKAGEVVEIDEAFSIGTLVVRTVPFEPVRVWIDGVVRDGAIGEPVQLAAGPHVVKVKNTATGRTATKSVNIEADSESVVELTID